MERRILKTRAEALAEKRQVRVTCSTESRGRDDLVLVSAGIDLKAYRDNPIVLWQHNPDWPIARAVEIAAVGSDLVALVQFPSEGTSDRADELYGLIREGVVNAASTGFETLGSEPIDPAKPYGAQRITRCELQEFSFVSIPALPDALVTERSRSRTMPEYRRSLKFHSRMAALYAHEITALHVARDAPPARRAPVKSEQRSESTHAFGGGRPAFIGDRGAWMAAMDVWRSKGGR